MQVALAAVTFASKCDVYGIFGFRFTEQNMSQKTGSRLSPKRNTVHSRLWGLCFSILGDVPNCDSVQTENPSSIGLWSDPKSESPDQDPRESQICLLGYYFQ